ncbi:hypothetical protein T10_3009 [Trichinella papuae]|uniref:Uncharacterized protein n=1 Tax=Trichinella papuae TaxID=268474 RepID=A0A0V1ML29_9BILA|nr:hypothetical protein T10_3009 [Trichinella papuae]
MNVLHINVCNSICVRCHLTKELLNIKSSCSMQHTFTAMQYFSRNANEKHKIYTLEVLFTNCLLLFRKQQRSL